MPKAKKFIDRKNAVTFHLVHRSQKDPLAADENAPQHVLVEAADKQQKSGEVIQRKEEERKFGVFFDDEYDYLQHLKDAQDVSIHWAPAVDPSKPQPTKEKSKSKKNVRLNLPSSVFASEVEEDVGLLNRAAPQSGLRLDLDPDVVAAMDEDFNFSDPENELEDNFMELAMKEGAIQNDEECSDDEDDSLGSQQGYASDGQYTDSDDEDDVDRIRGRAGQDRDDDNKSRFSQYSMSSSVMRRNNGLTLLDDRFEKMFAEYDDTEIGALDCDDIEGHLSATPEVLLKCAEEFSDQRKLYKLDQDKDVKKFIHMRGIAEEEEDDKDVDLFDTRDEDEEKKWDCESILSTYSNLYNHPKLIDEPRREKKIKISAKTGIPLGVIDGSDSGNVTMKSLARFNMEQAEFERAQRGQDGDSICDSVLSTLSILSLRPKDETPEERKERKRLLKEFRSERRLEKKANSEAFKEEKKRQEKMSINNRNNIQGIKIV